MTFLTRQCKERFHKTTRMSDYSLVERASISSFTARFAC